MPAEARLIDTAPLSLDEIEAEFVRAFAAGEDVARLHSGDLSVWSALAEQLRRLDRLGIPYTLTPGVPSFAAAAAALGRELTVPELAQSVVLTRVSGRASRMPERETLAAFGATGATLAIHLAIDRLAEIVATLTPSTAPTARRRWWRGRPGPTSAWCAGTLADIEAKLAGGVPERTALILVGPALGARDFRDSALYDAAYQRRFRGRDGS